MALRDRIGRLESRATPALTCEEVEVGAEACRRLATDDLLTMEDAFVRLGLEDDHRNELSWDEFTQRERAAFERYKEVKREVRDGRSYPHRTGRMPHSPGPM
jgi:hypothetical protein